MAWAKNGTPVTLGSAATGMNISDTSSSIFNTVLTHGINVTGDCAPRMRFNTASGSVYSRRYSDNGGADGTAVNQTYQYWYAGSSAGNLFEIAYVVGIAGEEKLSMVFNAWGSTAGAANAPARTEVVSKWAETSSSITSFNVDSGGTYWDTDSNISALGSDLTPAAAIPFAENAQAGSRAEITDTRKMYHFTEPSAATYEDDFSTDTLTHRDSSKTSVSGGLFNWEIELDNSDDSAYVSTGSISDSKFIVRFKYNTATESMVGNPGAFGKFCLSSTNTGDTNTFDWIGFQRYIGTASNSFSVAFGDNTSGNTGQTSFSTVPSSVSTYYIELIRDGSTVTANMYSDSSYSTLVETQNVTLTGTIENLSFFKFYNRANNSNSGQTMTGSIDDLIIYSGVTAIPTGNTWEEEGT